MILPFGIRRLPSTILERFCNLSELTIGFDEFLYHGQIRPFDLPGSLKTLTKLRIQSPSLSCQLPVNLDFLFPELLDLSYSILNTPEIESKKWVLPRKLQSIEIRSASTTANLKELVESLRRDELHILPVINVSKCEWFAQLPDGVHTIKTNCSIDARRPEPRDLGIIWPSSLTRLDISFFFANEDYFDYMEELFGGGPKGQLIPTFSQAENDLSLLNPKSLTSKDASASIKTWLNLPQTLYSLTGVFQRLPPTSSLPMILRNLNIATTDYDTHKLSLLAEQYFVARPELGSVKLQFKGTGRSHFACFTNPEFISTSMLPQHLSYANCFLGTKSLAIEDISQLPNTLTELELAIHDLYSRESNPKAIISMPPSLKKLTIHSPNRPMGALCPLPENIEKLEFKLYSREIPSKFYKQSAYFSFDPKSISLPPRLRSYISNHETMPIDAGFSFFPETLTELKLTESFDLNLDKFHPRHLPPLLRSLNLYFSSLAKQWDAPVIWWGAIPKHLPLEKLSLTFEPCDHPPRRNAPPVAFPYLHPTLMTLELDIFRVIRPLAEHIAHNLPRNCVVLRITCPPEDTLPPSLLNELPKSLRVIQTPFWKDEEVNAWLARRDEPEQN